MTQQYYFSFSELDTLLKMFNPGTPGPAGTTLEGFVFTPGADDQGNEKVFAFPLFSDILNKAGTEAAAGTGGGLLLQNNDVSGCPYPPKC